mgnify:FL=1
MKTKTKYIYKSGDWRDLYIIGEGVTFRWHSAWIITNVIYDKDKDRTSVKLVKI